jgi:hypothetical protein
MSDQRRPPFESFPLIRLHSIPKVVLADNSIYSYLLIIHSCLPLKLSLKSGETRYLNQPAAHTAVFSTPRLETHPENPRKPNHTIVPSQSSRHSQFSDRSKTSDVQSTNSTSLPPSVWLAQTGPTVLPRPAHPLLSKPLLKRILGGSRLPKKILHSRFS